MSGTLSSTTSSSVSRQAARIGRAAFLLPLGTMVPDSARPPRMTSLSWLTSSEASRRTPPRRRAARRATSASSVKKPTDARSAAGRGRERTTTPIAASSAAASAGARPATVNVTRPPCAPGGVSTSTPAIALRASRVAAWASRTRPWIHPQPSPSSHAMLASQAASSAAGAVEAS